MNNVVRHTQAIIAQVAVAGECSTVVAADEGERIRRLDGADSAVVHIVQQIGQHHFHRVMQHCEHAHGILMVLIAVAANIMTVIVENEFVPAQHFAAQTFKTYRADAMAAITPAVIQANYIVTFIFVTAGVHNSSNSSHGQEDGNKQEAHWFHKYNLDS